MVKGDQNNVGYARLLPQASTIPISNFTYLKNETLWPGTSVLVNVSCNGGYNWSANVSDGANNACSVNGDNLTIDLRLGMTNVTHSAKVFAFVVDILNRSAPQDITSPKVLLWC